MISDYTKFGKGDILVKKIVSGDIPKDDLVNHGVKFSGDYEKIHYENFYTYLGSTSRYLLNRSLLEKPYDGE